MSTESEAEMGRCHTCGQVIPPGFDLCRDHACDHDLPIRAIELDRLEAGHRVANEQFVETIDPMGALLWRDVTYR